MTARELINTLSALDPESLVVMASDAEGNGYAPDEVLYAADGMRGGAVDIWEDEEGEI